MNDKQIENMRLPGEVAKNQHQREAGLCWNRLLICIFCEMHPLAHSGKQMFCKYRCAEVSVKGHIRAQACLR